MKATRIYQVLNSVDRKTLNRFKKFINSPYFNINESIIQLGESIIESLKNGTEMGSKALHWESLSTSTTPYNDLQFRKLCNDLLERFERFLINETLDENNLLKANLLLDSIKSNKFTSLIEKQVKKSKRLIDREIDQSAEYFLRVYFNKKILQTLRSNYEKQADIKNLLNKSTYADLSKNLDCFYVIEKLRHATDVLTWRKLYKTDIDIDLGYALEMIDKYNLTETPAVKVYFLMYTLMSGLGNYTDYNELKSISFEEIDYFPKEERREIIDVLLSFVIKDINKGDKDALKEVLSLYDWGIDTDIILVKGFLTPTTFRNYIISCLRAGLFDQAEEFIDKKIYLLEKPYQENARNFNSARVMFYRKEFDKALSYLAKVNYDDVWYNLDSKILQLATYYESNEYLVLESAIDTFTKYLQRKKNIDQRSASAYLKFARLLKTFIQSPNLDLIQFKEKIKNTKPLLNKAWLLEKVEEKL